MNYYVYHIQCHPPEPARSVILSHLSDAGFESFQQTEKGLDAYISEEQFEKINPDALLEDLSTELEMDFSHEFIPSQNWNEKWESDYPVVTIDHKCIVRAPFHSVSSDKYELEVIISPKMSFGTGHHETTRLMLIFLLDMKMKGKTVLDMGSGTGVLGIAASKLGASFVKAVDVEHWAYENLMENARLNGVDIDAEQGDVAHLDGYQFDIILANINKNVLISDMEVYADSLKEKGALLLSGFFQTDVQDIKVEAMKHGLNISVEESKNGWAALKLEK